MPERVAAEPGMSEMTAQTLSAGALTCWVRLILWSMASSLVRLRRRFLPAGTGHALIVPERP